MKYARSWPAVRRRPRARRWPYKRFWKDKSLMFRNRAFAAVPAALLTLVAGASVAWAQADRRSRIDVEQYTIDAEVSPATQSLTAKATVRFIPVDDNISAASFELNNALNVSRVVDDKGKQIPASRNQQDFTVRLSFEQPLVKGQPVTIT